MKVLKYLLPLLLITNLQAQVVESKNVTCFTDSDYQKLTQKSSDCIADNKVLIKQLEDLLKSNEQLLIKVKELQTIESATPALKLDNLNIIVDKEGRVYVKDQLIGTLTVGSLSYKVSMKLNTTIAKARDKEYGFDLKWKAVVVESYERNADNKVEVFTSGALGIEPFYYKQFNINLIVGPRLFGPAVGMDITEHFDILTGVGSLYNSQKAFFFGGSFDF